MVPMEPSDYISIELGTYNYPRRSSSHLPPTRPGPTHMRPENPFFEERRLVDCNCKIIKYWGEI